MTDGLTPRLDAFLAARKLADDYELSDLSPQEINRLSMADYARIRERAGLPAADPFATAYTTPAPQQATAPAQSPAPDAPDPAAMSWQEYAAWREQSGLATRSAEGMSRAAISMSDRYARNDVPANGRRSFYSGS
jgi:hypothetical protein